MVGDMLKLLSILHLQELPFQSINHSLILKHLIISFLFQLFPIYYSLYATNLLLEALIKNLI